MTGAEGPQYRGAVCLAPMVRVGTLPMRLLAAKYGADLCYSEEMIDRRLMACRRQENPERGTVDFIDKKGHPCFRTAEGERARVVAQIGTAEAGNALRAASVVARDVAAVDINMGCPMHFSVSGGMGAALLQKPETIRDILTTLRRNLPVPVTCKIRLLEAPHKTLDLVRMIEGCGVAAIGVHGRRREQRPREPASWEGIRQAVAAVSVPVLANGDVFRPADVARVRAETGAAGVLVARGAMWNPSIFRGEEGFLKDSEVKGEYARVAHAVGNHLGNTKYVLREMVKAPAWFEGKTVTGEKGLSGPEGQGINRAKTHEDLCLLYDVATDGLPGSATAVLREWAPGLTAKRKREPSLEPSPPRPSPASKLEA